MSSSGPYQSRFLNLIVQQSRRLRDRSLQTLRVLRLGAVWGAQILLYPIYAAVQASRLVGRQLNQAVRRVVPHLRAATQAISAVTHSSHPLPSSAADTPIQKVLQTVQTFKLPGLADWVVIAPGADYPLLPTGGGGLVPAVPQAVTRFEPPLPGPLIPRSDGNSLSPTTPNPQPPTPNLQIQGIATLLDNRNLVLVTVENQILDILTSEQQGILRRQMIWEFAMYWYRQRQLRLVQRQQSMLLPPIVDRDYLFPPIRAFWKLMAWVQRSPVAIATNLFQEAALLPEAQVTVEPPLNLEDALWQRMTGWGRSLSPQRPLPDQWLTPAQVPLSDATGEIPQARFRQLASGQAQSAPQLPSSPLLAAAKQVLNLRDGIARMVRSLVARRADVSLPPPPAQPVASQDVSLTETAQQGDRSTSIPVLRFPWKLKPGTRSPINPLPQEVFVQQVAPPIISQVQNGLPVEEDYDSEGELFSGTIPACSAPLQPSPATVLDHTAGTAPTGLAKDESRTIDIQATLVGYVKHPLEQLLEWIDTAMVWIEEQVIQLWKWVQGRH